MKTLITIAATLTTASISASAESFLEEVGDFTHRAMPTAVIILTAVEGGEDAVKESGLAYLGRRFTVPKLKDEFPKRRPDGSSNRSFPSSHTASAFGAASTMHARYGLEYAVLPYTLATLTAISRVTGKHHYVEDVIAGAAIGMAWSFAVVSPKWRLETREDGGVGVSYTVNFK